MISEISVVGMDFIGYFWKKVLYMNIVIISILLPFPLNSGGAQAQYSMIDRLRKKHRITFIFPENGQNRKGAMYELQKRWPEVTFYPYSFVAQLLDPVFLLSKIRRAVKKVFCLRNERFLIERILQPYGYSLNERFIGFLNEKIIAARADIVQVEFFPFLSLGHKLSTDVYKIFVHHEIRYVRNERLLSALRLLSDELVLKDKVKEQELRDLKYFDRIITLTQVDKTLLLSEGVNVPIDVSPAAVNSEKREFSGWNNSISFLGGFVHTPNQEGMEWFMNEVVPLVRWENYPGIRLNIIGKGWPHTYQMKIGCVAVTLEGFVEHLSDALCGSIMIVPILSGSGMRMKILEAAALGVPFITTTVGVEGLDFVHGESCLIADTPIDFAKALTELMNDEKKRRYIAMNALRLYEQKYSVEALVKVRNEIYLKTRDLR